MSSAVIAEPALTAEQRFIAVYQSDRRRLFSVALALTGSAVSAEDVVQESFARAWQARWRIRSDEAIGGYLRRAVVNNALNGRRRPPTVDLPVDLPARAGLDPGTRLDLLQALSRLAPRRRACIVLRYLEELTEAETAEVLGVAVGTVKSQTARGLLQLQADLSWPADDRANRS